MVRRFSLLLGAAAVAGALTLHEPSSAYILPVYDVARFAGMLEQLRRMQQLKANLQMLVQTVRQSSQLLQQGNFLLDPITSTKRLVSDVGQIEYRLSGIEAQYRTVFPNREALEQAPEQEVQQMSDIWQAELWHASKVATRAQNDVKQLKKNTAVAHEIVQASQSSGGSSGGSKLAQMQALNRILNVVLRDMTLLSTSLAATARVDSVKASAETHRREAENIERTKALEGYAPAEPGQSEKVRGSLGESSVGGRR